MKTVRIRFTDESKRRGLGYLAGRFSFTSYATRETILSERALPALEAEGIAFVVEGPATYMDMVPALRMKARNEPK
jgi:hypothetical protein